MEENQLRVLKRTRSYSKKTKKKTLSRICHDLTLCRHDVFRVWTFFMHWLSSSNCCLPVTFRQIQHILKAWPKILQPLTRINCCRNMLSYRDQWLADIYIYICLLPTALSKLRVRRSGRHPNVSVLIWHREAFKSQILLLHCSYVVLISKITLSFFFFFFFLISTLIINYSCKGGYCKGVRLQLFRPTRTLVPKRKWATRTLVPKRKWVWGFNSDPHARWCLKGNGFLKFILYIKFHIYNVVLNIKNRLES